MKTWTIVCYRQYGRWSATIPFPTPVEAARHVERYFFENVMSADCKSIERRPVEHYKDITYLSVELPE